MARHEKQEKRSLHGVNEHFPATNNAAIVFEMASSERGLYVKHVPLTAQTPLKDIPLTFMDAVLAERFLLPPESFKRFKMPVPQTIQEIAEAGGFDVEHVIRVMTECLTLNEQVWTRESLDALATEDQVWIVDMRPMVDYDAEPLHPSARIFHHGNQARQLELMRTMKKIIVLSDRDAHAWSAAMGLRQMQIPAFVLAKN